MADLNNFTRGRAARELVAITFRQAGFEEAQQRIPPRRLSERIGLAPEDRSDVLGIEGWHIAVAADLHNRWSERLDAAASIAAEAGVENFAVIEHRRDRDARDWYAVLTVADLARLIRQASRAEAAA